jgi:uncharacterized protein YndB with AHSA1/START domain
MADGNGRSVRLERQVRVPPERAFRAWTAPDEVRRWWCPNGFVPEDIEIDLRIGGRFRLAMRSAEGNRFVASGTYTDVDPPRRIAHSWVWDHTPEVETYVTVEFRPDGGGTRIVLTHDGFPDAAAAARHREGWTSLLDNLDAYRWED